MLDANDAPLILVAQDGIKAIKIPSIEATPAKTIYEIFLTMTQPIKIAGTICKYQ